MRNRPQARVVVPSDWETKPLGSVVDRVADRNTRRNQNVLTISAQAGLISQNEYFSRRVASKEVTSYFLLRRGDFAYNKSYSAGFPVGVIRRLERYAEGIVSPLYICFRVAGADVDSDFLKYCFAAGLLDDDIAWVAKEGVRNHGLLNVGVGDFFSVPVHLPPLREQRRVAEILDTLDQTIRKTEELVAKLKQVKRGLLHDLLTRGIDDNGELRDPNRHPETFERSELGRIPRGWTTGSLGAVARVVDPNPSHRYPPEVSDGVPICSTENFLGDDDYDLADTTKVPEGVFLAQAARCGFAKDDIVFARKGRIGFARPYGAQRKVFSHTVVLMKPIEGEVAPRFLLWAVRADSFFRGIRDRMNSNVGVPTLGVGFLSAVVIARPPPDEQSRIAAALDATSERVVTEQANLAKLELLKQGLSKDLLTGGVRVTKLLEEEAA